MYHPEDWSKTNGQDYLARARSQRPDIQISEILATLGPAVSRVEDEFAQRYAVNSLLEVRIGDF
jgi:hypothetical protein